MTGKITSSGGVLLLRPRYKSIPARKVTERLHSTRVLGPEGEVLVNSSMTTYSELSTTIVMVDETGARYLFSLVEPLLYLTPETSKLIERSDKYAGFRVRDGEIEETVVLQVEGVRNIRKPTYGHTIVAGGPIYIGAGKNPVYLPFRAR